MEKEPKHNFTQLHASAASWVGTTRPVERVVLQKDLANVNEKEEFIVRVLFDTGSHKSFVTDEAVCKLGLRPVRKEKLGIRAFGQREREKRCSGITSILLEVERVLFCHVLLLRI